MVKEGGILSASFERLEDRGGMMGDRGIRDEVGMDGITRETRGW